ncbi:hypothetical protein OCOL_000718 [Ordospora colligata]
MENKDRSIEENVRLLTDSYDTKEDDRLKTLAVRRVMNKIAYDQGINAIEITEHIIKDNDLKNMVSIYLSVLKDLHQSAIGFMSKYEKCSNEIDRLQLIGNTETDLLIYILNQRSNDLIGNHDLKKDLKCISEDESKTNKIVNSIEDKEELIMLFENLITVCNVEEMKAIDNLVNAIVNKLMKTRKDLENALDRINKVVAGEKFAMIMNGIDDRNVVFDEVEEFLAHITKTIKSFESSKMQEETLNPIIEKKDTVEEHTIESYIIEAIQSLSGLLNGMKMNDEKVLSEMTETELEDIMYQTEKLKVVTKVVAVFMILEVDKILAKDIFADVLNMIGSKQTQVIVQEVIVREVKERCKKLTIEMFAGVLKKICNEETLVSLLEVIANHIKISKNYGSAEEAYAEILDGVRYVNCSDISGNLNDDNESDMELRVDIQAVRRIVIAIICKYKKNEDIQSKDSMKDTKDMMDKNWNGILDAINDDGIKSIVESERKCLERNSEIGKNVIIKERIPKNMSAQEVAALLVDKMDYLRAAMILMSLEYSYAADVLEHIPVKNAAVLLMFLGDYHAAALLGYISLSGSDRAGDILWDISEISEYRAARILRLVSNLGVDLAVKILKRISGTKFEHAVTIPRDISVNDGLRCIKDEHFNRATRILWRISKLNENLAVQMLSLISVEDPNLAMTYRLLWIIYNLQNNY